MGLAVALDRELPGGRIYQSIFDLPVGRASARARRLHLAADLPADVRADLWFLSFAYLGLPP